MIYLLLGVCLFFLFWNIILYGFILILIKCNCNLEKIRIQSFIKVGRLIKGTFTMYLKQKNKKRTKE